MTGSLTLFRLFGVPVVVHWSFVFLLILIGPTLGPIITAAVIVCMLAHEFGHVLVARRFGMHTTQVTMFGLGMAAHLEDIPRRGEATMAAAGPAVNFVIAMLIAAVVLYVPMGAVVVKTLEMIIWVNLVLGLFNLIPIYPLDGGRVLRGLASHFTSRLTATKIAASIGTAGAFALVPWALTTGNIIVLVILVLAVAMAWYEVKLLKENHESTGFY